MPYTKQRIILEVDLFNDELVDYREPIEEMASRIVNARMRQLPQLDQLMAVELLVSAGMPRVDAEKLSPVLAQRVEEMAEEVLENKIAEMAELDLERAYASGYLAGLERQKQ